MGKMLLGLAAAIAVLATAPAAAQTFNGGNSGGGFIAVGGGNGFDQRGHHRRSNGEIGTWINGGEWALYNNRPFQPDSFNGWWHDRPDRAYPAWMRNNQDCAKPWFQGSVLRC